MKNRRKFSRIQFVADVELVFDGLIYQADLLDLSLKGALLRPQTPLLIKPGDLCYFRINLTDRNCILEFTAEAVHSRDDRLGFKFISLDIDTMTHLRRLLELNLSDRERVRKELSFLATA
ncbi:MAG: PilZ domain-containing protein [bacterium]